MKIYWDSSALIEAVYQPDLKARFEHEGGITRPHALAEIFSTLTANPATRLDSDVAAKIISAMSDRLEFVDLTAPEIIAGLKQCRRLGVRGGRVHDYLHALAAKKCGADKILTLDRNDFAGLGSIPVEQA